MAMKRTAVPRKWGIETTATANFVPSQLARSGVRMLPIPNPAIDAIAPARMPAHVTRIA
jgi:hypothetical protein